MLPFSPGLTVRALVPEDLEQARALINAQLVQATYSRTMDEQEAYTQLFDQNPPTIYAVRWQKRQLLGAWRAGELSGIADIATGLDSDSATLPEYQPVGLMRFFIPARRPELSDDVADDLLAAANQFWQANKIGHVKAYHISTGYPQFQAGAGLLHGDWAEQVRYLTSHGFSFDERYYCLARPLDQLFEETVPQTALSLAFRGDANDRTYQVFFRRTELVGEMRLMRRQDATENQPFAYLAEWKVDSRWRNQDIGRWLLRRAINDATNLGNRELVVHVKLQHSAAMNLLTQHGFIELNYRGYSLVMDLEQ